MYCEKGRLLTAEKGLQDDYRVIAYRPESGGCENSERACGEFDFWCANTFSNFPYL